MTARPDGAALPELASVLDAREIDGYLLDAPSTVSDQLYLSGFDAPDSFLTLYEGDSRAIRLLVSSLEYGRARARSRAASVERHADYDYRAKLDAYGEAEARYRMYAEFLASHGVESVAVPPRFPVGTADGLRDRGVGVAPEHDGIVTRIRARKTPEEIEHVRTAQCANERAMAAAESLLIEATVSEGVLRSGDEPLTAERVKGAIERALLEAGCGLDETIVACGADAADPHDRGSGPLEADEAIIVDIFPRDKESKYHADMTRTFLVGEPSAEIRERYEHTREAFDAALAAIEPGTTGAAVHDAVCEVYEAAGYPTLRSDESTEVGFIHSTGHGVGLDVHELPRLAPSGGELEPGHVVTVEPGLYDPDVGGIRIEDLVAVTAEGYENLTEYPKELVV